jgi:hypothetical protein
MKLDPKEAAKSRKQYPPEVMAEPSSAPADQSNTRFEKDEPMFAGNTNALAPNIKGQAKYGK